MDTGTAAERKKPFRWGFVSASAMILFLMVVGQAVRLMIDGFNEDGMKLKDWLFLGFVGSSFAFLWLQRHAVLHFFRSMHVGVSLVGLSTLAVLLGVLVPQIDGFEDPKQRVTAENYEEQYKAFRWAEGYFLWHVLHLYGIGMPEESIPPQAEEGLERFSKRYGYEEGSNREKQMRAAFSGQLKTQEIGAFIDKHDSKLRTFFDIATTLHLNRTYKSYWFASLLMLLFCGVACNTFRGRPSTWLSVRKSGWFVVHMGVMTLLIGGLVSNQTTYRGIMHLDTREGPQDEFWAYFDRNQRRRLPFHIKLDRFARRNWKTLEVGFHEDSFTSRPPTYTLWPGRVVELDFVEGDDGEPRPMTRIEVAAIHERANVLPPTFSEMEQPDESSLGALAVLSVTDWDEVSPQDAAGDGALPERPLFLKPDWEGSTFLDPLWQYRVRTSFGSLDEGRELLTEASTSGVIGYLAMRVATEGDVRDDVVPIRLGETIEGPGGYSIHIAEATADFRVDPDNPTVEIRDPRPLKDQYPRNPAVWVEIQGPYGGEAERRPVIERLDAEQHSLQSRFQNPELVLKLQWERWLADGPPRYVLSWNDAGEGVLLTEDGQELPARPGQRLELPGRTRLVPQQFLVEADFTKNFTFSDPYISGPHFDVNFYSTDPTGVELSVTRNLGTPEETTELVQMAATEQGLSDRWESDDKELWMRYFENEQAFPFEWRSVLSVWERKPSGELAQVDLGPEAAREIRVNDYFYHRGYRFFQTNAIPELPTYSGIGVVRDDGIPIVLAGMYIIIAGTVLAFIVRPIVERRTRRPQAAGGAS